MQCLERFLILAMLCAMGNFVSARVGDEFHGLTSLMAVLTLVAPFSELGIMTGIANSLGLGRRVRQSSKRRRGSNVGSADGGRHADARRRAGLTTRRRGG